MIACRTSGWLGTRLACQHSGSTAGARDAANGTLRVSRYVKKKTAAVLDGLSASLMLTLLAFTGHAAAQDAQDEPEPLVAREVVVLLVDRFGDTANASDLFGSTFSAGASTQRTRDAGAGAIPGGFITFSGGPATLEPFDVLVELKDGKFMAGWPRQDQRRDDRLLWQDLRSDTAADAQPPTLPEDHWMSPLRSDSRRLLQHGRIAERFVFYDAAVDYTAAVEVQEHDGGYRVIPKGEESVGTIILIQPRGERNRNEGWRVSAASAVRGAEAAAEREEAGATQPAGATTQPNGAATRPATTQAAGDGSGAPRLSPNAMLIRGEAGTPTDALAVALPLLGDLSMLGEPELAYTRAVFEAHAFNEAGLTVVYRLDRETLDRLLPLDIAPAPDELHRVGIVILLNADPALQDRVAKLITELGDEDWATREAAQRQLKALGRAAVPELEKHRGDEDPEVRYRVQQLLEAEPAG